tara:strand:+ start:84 stop:299 length:216 start_codon:yes stop_codon:yes gene_type:complete
MRAGIYILNEDDAKELSSIELSDKVKEVFNNAYCDDRQSNREWSDIIRTSDVDYSLSGMNYPSYGKGIRGR